MDDFDKDVATMLLFKAVERNDIEKIKYSIEQGANVNAGEAVAEQTPLHIAADKGYIEAVELLINHGANVNAKDHVGGTPLYWTNSVAVAELLINKGADVNAQDNAGWPLVMACKKEIIELLIAHGADVNAKDNEGKTPLINYVEGLNADGDDVIELLLANGADVNIKDDNGKTALDYAEAMDDKKMSKLLIAHGAIKS